ncbi:hypothetical protein BLNAU_7385 [Blattamonas nauphoetae]|uniref:Phosphatidylinositol-glycan biosynthesis class X protein n=1 Tax=Blattamonas nauphoetae TaxID=2049346 RepID=A0ABQ9Y1X4_9EUKA|nr:hypothetical protein BLNAU_7385 [Blattamonas nauphoetae]
MIVPILALFSPLSCIKLQSAQFSKGKLGYHISLDTELTLTDFNPYNEICEIVQVEEFSHEFYINPYELNTLHLSGKQPKRYYDPSLFPELEHVHYQNITQPFFLLSHFRLTKESLLKDTSNVFYYTSSLPIHLRYQPAKNCVHDPECSNPVVYSPQVRFYSRCDESQQSTLQSLISPDCPFSTFDVNNTKYFYLHTEASDLQELLHSRGWTNLNDEQVITENGKPQYVTYTIQVPVADLSKRPLVDFFTIGAVFIALILLAAVVTSRSSRQKSQ